MKGQLELPSARWRVRVPGQLPRWYAGRLTFQAVNERLVVVATLPLEAYVAEVTASETELDTPPAAMRAQAIVARSYVLAAGRRHPEADACDMAHCQVLRGDGQTRHREEARAAVAATRGVVLRLETGATGEPGRIALAPFHGACGGHTADPIEIFGGPDHSGAASVSDPGCGLRRWQASVTKDAVERAAAQALAPGLAGLGDSAPPRWADLELQYGHGGYLVRVVDRRRGVAGSGDAFVRALAAEAGWDVIRGDRFELKVEGAGSRSPGGLATERVVVRGQGTGHGVGLCQLGATRLALQGQSHATILKRYFPLARLGVQ